MWGYYANGFKGVAVEVETNDYEVKKMNYESLNVLFDNNKNIDTEVEKILLNKNVAWKHEDEYRFLDKLKNNSAKIEKITAIYFGTPYDYIENSEQVQKDRKSFIQYKYFKEKIIKTVKGKDIKCFNVRIKNDSVKTEKNCLST